MVGLRATDILRQRFPDSYAAHVAGLTTRPTHLLGIVQALFSLVESHGVELPDFLDIRTNPRDPAAALLALPSHLTRDDDALAVLDECRWAVAAFHPVVYGQTHEVEPLFESGRQNLLLLLLWALADQTAWSPWAADLQDVIDYAVSELSVERQVFAERIVHLRDQRWPRNLPMDEFARHLDQVNYRELNLGKAVRYAFTATGLQFADLSMEELDEMGWTGMDWYSVDFDAVAAEQAEARDFLQHYYDLDNLVSAQPEVFDEVLVLLTALFQTLAREAQTTYQALLAQQPADQHDHVVLAVEPARLGASAQLLLDSPALNAAVSLLALGATLTQRT